MCYRHFARLPEKLRGWLARAFKPAGLTVKGSDTWKAVGACRQWAKANPDPELPPFKKGDKVRPKESGLFTKPEYTIELCLLNDRKEWVAVTTDGTNHRAKDLEPIR